MDGEANIFAEGVHSYKHSFIFRYMAHSRDIAYIP